MNRQRGFWAITSYFNPAGYRRRLENYRLFRDRLCVPLVAVELSHTGEFQLHPRDAEILIQLHCPDVLWHKERLLNIALRALPSDCETVAWLDCDLVFESRDWPERTSRLLETHPLVTPFHTACFLSPNAQSEGVHSILHEEYSLMYALASGLAGPDAVSGDSSQMHRIAVGLAGAARRALLDRHGFYDGCVMGGGDRSLLCAALGRFDDQVQFLRMGPGWARQYRAWAKPFFESVQGRVTYLEERIFHLWHGDLENRAYRTRHTLLHHAGFDPETDLVSDQNGCWRWHPSRTGLHQQVRGYFESRREDG